MEYFHNSGLFVHCGKVSGKHNNFSLSRYPHNYTGTRAKYCSAGVKNKVSGELCHCSWVFTDGICKQYNYKQFVDIFTEVAFDHDLICEILSSEMKGVGKLDWKSTFTGNLCMYHPQKLLNNPELRRVVLVDLATREGPCRETVDVDMEYYAKFWYRFLAALSDWDGEDCALAEPFWPSNQKLLDFEVWASNNILTVDEMVEKFKKKEEEYVTDRLNFRKVHRDCKRFETIRKGEKTKQCRLRRIDATEFHFVHTGKNEWRVVRVSGNSSVLSGRCFGI